MNEQNTPEVISLHSLGDKNIFELVKKNEGLCYGEKYLESPLDISFHASDNQQGDFIKNEQKNGGVVNRVMNFLRINLDINKRFSMYSVRMIHKLTTIILGSIFFLQINNINNRETSQVHEICSLFIESMNLSEKLHFDRLDTLSFLYYLHQNTDKIHVNGENMNWTLSDKEFDKMLKEREKSDSDDIDWSKIPEVKRSNLDDVSDFIIVGEGEW